MALKKVISDSRIKKWRVEVHKNESTGRWYVITVNTHTLWNDNPMMMDGRLYFDFPERIPQYAKRLTRSGFREMERLKKMEEKDEQPNATSSGN